MAVGESVVSTLIAKLILNTADFIKNSDSVTKKIGTVAAGFTAMGGVAAKDAKSSISAAMDFETAFAGVMKTIDAPKGDVPSFGTGMASMGSEAASSGTAPVLRLTGLQGTSEQALGAFPVLRVIR